MGILIGLITSLLIPLAFVAVIVAGMWKVFTKAGQPGWASIVPIYNVYVLTIEIAKKEILWFILWLIPLVNIVPAILIPIELAKKFGKDTAYGLGLVFLPFIFYPMPGFGDAQYEGATAIQGGKKKSYDADDEGGKNW